MVVASGNGANNYGILPKTLIPGTSPSSSPPPTTTTTTTNNNNNAKNPYSSMTAIPLVTPSTATPSNEYGSMPVPSHNSNADQHSEYSSMVGSATGAHVSSTISTNPSEYTNMPPEENLSNTNTSIQQQQQQQQQSSTSHGEYGAMPSQLPSLLSAATSTPTSSIGSNVSSGSNLWNDAFD